MAILMAITTAIAIPRRPPLLHPLANLAHTAPHATGLHDLTLLIIAVVMVVVVVMAVVLAVLTTVLVVMTMVKAVMVLVVVGMAELVFQILPFFLVHENIFVRRYGNQVPVHENVFGVIIDIGIVTTKAKTNATPTPATITAAVVQTVVEGPDRGGGKGLFRGVMIFPSK